MNHKQYFFLTAKIHDRQKQFFISKFKNLLDESKKLESEQEKEIIRVALQDKESFDFIMAECPYLKNKVLTEYNKIMANKQQQTLGL